MADQRFFVFENKKYPIFTFIDRNGSLTQVKGIPLKCPACPNVPRFKDISHLLTHYGSRDHLKAANETKIRSDLGIPESVRVYSLYKLWEAHNHLWRWLVESHRRKNKMSEIKIEDEEFPEYQEPIDYPVAPKMAQAIIAEGSPAFAPFTPITGPAPTPQAKHGKGEGMDMPTYVPAPTKKAAGRAKRGRAPASKVAPAKASSEILEVEAPVIDPALDPAVVETPPVSGQKRPRGRPRKYPIGSKPQRRSQRAAPTPTRKALVELPIGIPHEDPPQTPMEAPNWNSNSLDFDPEIDFPVDPRAPKAKPLRVRRSKDGSEVYPDGTHRSGPVLKGKTYPGMAVYDYGNMPRSEQSVNILITAADQQTLPFDVDGHILHFDDEDHSILMEGYDEEQVEERPSKRTKKHPLEQESDESYDEATTTEDSNDSLNFSNSTRNEDSDKSANISASTEDNESLYETINLNQNAAIRYHYEGINLGASPADGDGMQTMRRSFELIDGNDTSDESVVYNHTNESHPSFAIFEDGDEEDHNGIEAENMDPFLCLDSHQRQPLQELASIGARDNHSQRQSYTTDKLQHRGNGQASQIKDINGVDLYQANPFNQFNSQAVPTTFRSPVLPRQGSVRTYEGLSAEGPHLGWQGSFAPSFNEH